MSIDEYKRRVIDLFRSGKATDQMYEEMAEAVLHASEARGGYIPPEAIDAHIDSREEATNAPR